MKYPTMGERRQYRVSLPQLNGGVNYSVLPHLIGDNQLSDVKNLWFRDGVLKARPGVAFLSDLSDVHDDPQNTFWFDRYSSEENRCILSYHLGLDNKRTTAIIFDGETSFEIESDGDHPQVIPWFSETNIDIEGRDETSLSLMYYCTRHETGRIFAFDKNGVQRMVRPYVPTVLKKGVPKKNFNDKTEGVQFEPYNLLTGNYKCEYTADGESQYYRLPKGEILRLTVAVTSRFGSTKEYVAETPYQCEEDRFLISDSENGWEMGNIRLVVDPAEGVFWFATGEPKNAVAFGKTGLVPDVVATVEKENTEENVQKIYGMRFSTWYGGGSSGLSTGTRLFVSGNPDHPNLMHWSALNNPLYFPENNYSYVGSDKKSITAFGKQEDLLVVFKEDELYCSKYYDGRSVTYEELKNQEAVDIEAARAVFPLVQLHPSIGCDRPKTVCLCNNRLVWFNSDGKVYGLFSANQYSERNVRELSLCVERELKKATADKSAVAAAEFENHYLLLCGNTVFVMDFSSVGFTHFASYSSDEKSQKAVQWYRWDLGDDRRFADVFNQGNTVVLLERKDDGFEFYRLTAPEENKSTDDVGNDATVGIATSLATKLFDFGYADRYKRINPFYLHISGEEGKEVNLTYLNENGAGVDTYHPTLTGADISAVSPIRATPNAIRVREFGIRIDCDGGMVIGGLTLNYSVMGTVR